MLHHSKHAPVPTILRLVADANLKSANFAQIGWCELKVFVFILFKFKKRPNISRIRVI